MPAYLSRPPSTAKTAVSADAVIKRVNRRMKILGITLKAMPPGSRREQFGQFCVVGPDHLIADKHVDLDQIARELGVLKDDEEIRTPGAGNHNNDDIGKWLTISH